MPWCTDSLFLNDVFGCKDLDSVDNDFNVNSILVPRAQFVQVLVISWFVMFITFIDSRSLSHSTISIEFQLVWFLIISSADTSSEAKNPWCLEDDDQGFTNNQKCDNWAYAYQCLVPAARSNLSIDLDFTTCVILVGVQKNLKVTEKHEEVDNTCE